jgi:hypothetical protein
MGRECNSQMTESQVFSERELFGWQRSSASREQPAGKLVEAERRRQASLPPALSDGGREKGRLRAEAENKTASKSAIGSYALPRAAIRRP